MALSLRAVVCDRSGAVAIVVEQWRLRAVLVLEAPIEADKRSCATGDIVPNALEITDATGTVVARRGYLGRHCKARHVANVDTRFVRDAFCAHLVGVFEEGQDGVQKAVRRLQLGDVGAAG